MWFRDFHIDALRLDAVHAIKDFSTTHILEEIKRRVDELMKESGRQHYLVLELDLNDPRFINPLQEKGFGMDAQWIDEFHHALRVTAGGDTTGYYSDFSGISQLAKAYSDAYVYDGTYSPHRKRNFGKKLDNNPGSQFVVFSQNHDQIGNRMLGERTSQLCSFEMQKLLAGAVMVAPFLPMLFMGEEWSESHPFLYFVSHTEPELAEAVRKGRKEEFAAFQNQGEAPDPMAEKTFNESKLQWQLLNKEPNSTMFTYYQTLIAIRKQLPALNQLDRQQVAVQFSEEQNSLILERWCTGEHVCCLMNFSGDKQVVALPGSFQWQKVLDSAEPKWKGSIAAAQQLTGGSACELQPESIIIYLSKNV